MALTRKSLKAMGLTDEQVDSIIEMHSETVDGLKADVQKFKGDAEKLPGIQKELDELKAKGDGGWEKKAKDFEKKYNDLVSDNTAKAAQAAKEKAVRAFYQSKNITGDNLEIAMLSSGETMKGLEMDGEKIKDTAALDALVGGTLAKLVTTTKVTGANTETPPPGASKKTYTTADIAKMSTAEINQNWDDIKASLKTNGG
jgi:hypothetical protein